MSIEPIDRIRNNVNIIDSSEEECNHDINDVVSRIKRLHARNALVPVICEDMYEYVNPITEERQSLHSYLVEKVVEKLNKRGIKLNLTETELTDIVNEGYYGMSLLRAKAGKEIYEELCDSVIDEDNEIYRGICLKDEVKKFLVACDFPLIITTSCYPIIENELNGYESYWCELETRNDVPIPKKCIYHIFGEAKPENSNWGYNDKQLLKFLRLVYTNDYSLKNLTSVINNTTSKKALLVMGNDAPDWLFRFMLTPIYGGDVYDDGKGFYMNESNNKEENGLNQFLRDIKFEKESQLITVLNLVSQKFQKVELFHNKYHGMKYDFFVAHASEDRESAEKLVACMRDNGLNVWVDYENIKDGFYWSRIIDALKNSAYFMPLITGKYILKNKDRSTREQSLQTIGVEDLSLEMTECMNLEKFLEGVQIELLLADKWAKLNAKDTYSIPVILSGSELYDEPITAKRIGLWGEKSRRLPQRLFWGVQMYEFNENMPQSFVLDWCRYKTIL